MAYRTRSADAVLGLEFIVGEVGQHTLGIEPEESSGQAILAFMNTQSVSLSTPPQRDSRSLETVSFLSR
jgi:hypothetical protein